MPNSVSSQLNLIRHYKFTFFDIIGSGSSFQIQPLPNTLIQDSINFSFSYTVTNSILNNARFMFYNMAEDTIKLFTSQQNRRGFIFETWYGNDTQGNKTIFSGLTYTTNTYRQGVDTITEVVGCDILLNLLLGSITLSYPAGTPYLTIVQGALAKYGGIISLNSFSNQFLTGSYKSPKTYKSQLIPLLQTIATDAGLLFSMQLNTITMIPGSLNTTTSNAIQTINAQNGLVSNVRAESLSVQLLPVFVFDNQQLNKNLSILTVSTLIRPYNLYDKVYLQTQRFTGYYGILSLTHSGEWRGNQWYSTMRLWPDSTGKT